MKTKTKAKEETDIFMHVRTEKVKDSLTEAELRLLLHVMYKRCSAYVFAFIRAYELGGYRPAMREAEHAYRKLCALFVCEDFVIQILQYYIANENRRLVRACAESDPRFLKASEALRGITYTPLMVEVPQQEAFTLWALAGSWTGALILCGIESLERNARRDRIKRYMLSHASVSLLPTPIRQTLPEECLAVVEKLCAQARMSRRIPDIQESDESLFSEAGYSLDTVMLEVGVKVVNAQERSRRQMVERWKKKSEYWKNTPEYKALTNRSHEENQQIRRERKQQQKMAAQALSEYPCTGYGAEQGEATAP